MANRWLRLTVFNKDDEPYECSEARLRTVLEAARNRHIQGRDDVLAHGIFRSRSLSLPRTDLGLIVLRLSRVPREAADQEPFPLSRCRLHRLTQQIQHRVLQQRINTTRYVHKLSLMYETRTQRDAENLFVS